MIGAHPILDSDFPGYAEAVAREQVVRGAACLGLNEKICGLEVKPLTAYHVRWLGFIKSPFMRGNLTAEVLAEKPDITSDIIGFLWIVSPMFKPGIGPREIPKPGWLDRNLWGGIPASKMPPKTERDFFNEAFAPIMKQRVDAVCREILEYVDEAFIDLEEGPPGSDKSYFAFEVSIAHELHDAYGYRVDFWNAMPVEANPVHVPLKLIFQFRKIRRKWNDPKAIISNRSERFISIGLEKINRDQKPEKN